LGRTGAKVSAIGLGGYHLGNPKDAQESIRIIRTALDSGINFLDNCWDYHDGDSEVRMGKALRDGYRQRAFLMTKIDGHTKGRGATRRILAASRPTTWTCCSFTKYPHGGFRQDFAPGGAWKPSSKRKKPARCATSVYRPQGSDIHLKMLQVAAAHQFHFDAVQMPSM
jgi:hypothetical protein